MEARGGEGGDVAFSGVPGALGRGAIGCAATITGRSAGGREVSTRPPPRPLDGWGPAVAPMNLDRSEALPAEAREAIRSEVAAGFESRARDAAAGSLADAIVYPARGGRASGEPASTTPVEPIPEDEATARRALAERVLPDGAERAGGDGAERGPGEARAIGRGMAALRAVGRAPARSGGSGRAA